MYIPLFIPHIGCPHVTLPTRCNFDLFCGDDPWQCPLRTSSKKLLAVAIWRTRARIAISCAGTGGNPDTKYKYPVLTNSVSPSQPTLSLDPFKYSRHSSSRFLQIHRGVRNQDPGESLHSPRRPRWECGEQPIYGDTPTCLVCGTSKGSN